MGDNFSPIGKFCGGIPLHDFRHIYRNHRCLDGGTGDLPGHADGLALLADLAQAAQPPLGRDLQPSGNERSAPGRRFPGAGALRRGN